MCVVCVCVCSYAQPGAGVIWCSSMWASVPLPRIRTLSARSPQRLSDKSLSCTCLFFLLRVVFGTWGLLVRCPCASLACLLCQSHAEAGAEGPPALPARTSPQKFLLICSKTEAKAKVLSSATPNFAFRDVKGQECQSVSLCPCLFAAVRQPVN